MAEKRSSAGLKTESLKKIATEMHSQFGDDIGFTQVRNFWNKQKSLWSLVNWLRSATGLGFDPVNDCITADEEWWQHALQVKPELKSLRNKNIKEILHYRDILFKNATSTREHVVYPSTICGVQALPELTSRLDLNIGPAVDDGTGSYVPSFDFQVGGLSPAITPGSRSSRSSKRKSIEGSESNRKGKRHMVGSQLLDSLEEGCKEKVMKEASFPSMESCWPHLREIRNVNSKLTMYGSVLLDNNPKQRNLFLGWGTIEEKVEWLEYMEKSGYK